MRSKSAPSTRTWSESGMSEAHFSSTIAPHDSNITEPGSSGVELGSLEAKAQRKRVAAPRTTGSGSLAASLAKSAGRSAAMDAGSGVVPDAVKACICCGIGSPIEAFVRYSVDAKRPGL